jgi:hypothetical protein
MSAACGTWSAYNMGCHCGNCRAAAREYKRELRARHRNGWPDHLIPHGTAAGYSEYACKCPACTEAQRLHSARMRARRRVREGKPLTPYLASILDAS